MRILAIESSTRRGSVALLEGEQLVHAAHHEEASAHAERLLPLIEQALASAAWTRSSVDRIAVGVGPGSFVGLRVGISLAEGIALGLGRPVVGVCSLAAMTAAVPHDISGARVALLDARRGELFVYAHASDGRVLLEPTAIAETEIAEHVHAIASELVLVGSVAPRLQLPYPVFESSDCAWPSAHWVGRLARALDPESAPPLPLYVRGPGAIQPVLPPSPFAE